MSGEGKDAFKALEGRAVHIFKCKFWHISLGSDRGNEDKAKHEPTWATPNKQGSASYFTQVRSQWVAEVLLQDSLALSSQEVLAQ